MDDVLIAIGNFKNKAELLISIYVSRRYYWFYKIFITDPAPGLRSLKNWLFAVPDNSTVSNTKWIYFKLVQ